MELVWLGMFVFFAAFAIPAFWQAGVFEELVKYEYEHHREQWEKDGKPYGMFWIPEESKAATVVGMPVVRMESRRAQTRLNWAWMAQTPAWAVANPEIEGRFRLFRTLGGVMWAVVGIGFIAGIVILASLP